jgi:predicted 3-demethylubiquinone-9 3-methyltransferase (glyoxalase superfamily)
VVSFVERRSTEQQTARSDISTHFAELSDQRILSMAKRAFEAMMTMAKIDIAALEAAVKRN